MKKMQQMPRAVVAVAILCLFNLDTVNAELSTVSPSPMPVYPQAVQPGMITGTCEGTLAPDRAVIIGGITAESLKPLQAKAQLEKQIGEMEKYVASKHGKISLLEAVRAIRQRQQGNQRRHREAELPFILVQRLEFEFQSDIEIDEILERLLQLGFDRYGRNIRPQHGSYGPQVVVYYRFADAMGTLERIYRRCKQQVVRKWCQDMTERVQSTACRAGPARLDQYFPTRSLRLQSQRVLTEHGSQPITISFPWQAEHLKAVELMGDVTLRLTGTLALSIPQQPSQ